MAHPSVIVEQAVRYFLQQWSFGLQPSLTLTTLADGAICASSKVSSPSPSVTKKQQHPIDSTYHYRHRSGQNSRSRRRKLRQQNSVLCDETKLQTLSVASNESNFKNVVPKSQVTVVIEEETQFLTYQS